MEGLYKGFKKIAEDNNSAVLEHENGHKLHIAKSGLSKKHLKTLEKLPIHQYNGSDQLTDERIASLQEEMDAAKAAQQQPMYTPYVRPRTAIDVGESIREKELKPMAEDVMDYATGLGKFAKQVTAPVLSAGMAINEFGKKIDATTGEVMRGMAGLEGQRPQSRLEREYAQAQPSQQTAEQAPTFEETQVQQPLAQPEPTTTPQDVALHKEHQATLAQPPVSRDVAVGKSPEQKTQEMQQQVATEQQPKTILSRDEMVMMDPNADPYERQVATQNLINTRLLARKKADDMFYQEMMKPENDIKIENYFHDKSAFQQIVGALSLLAGGASAGLLRTENPAMKIIDNAINRELEVQKLSKERKLNLYKIHREAEGDEIAGLIQASNNLRQLVQMKAEKMRGLTPGTTLFNQRLAKEMSDIETGLAENRLKLSEMDINRKQLAIRDEALSGRAVSGAPGTAGLRADDPARYVDVLFKDEKAKERANKELEHRLFINDNAPKVLRLFDQIDKFGPTPGATDAFQGLLTTLIPAIEGTTGMGLLESARSKFTPGKVTFPGANARKRRALVDWMVSKSAAPTWRKYPSFNLDSFSATAHPWAKNTVERVTKDGKVALFDADTKQFVGYK